MQSTLLFTCQRLKKWDNGIKKSLIDTWSVMGSFWLLVYPESNMLCWAQNTHYQLDNGQIQQKGTTILSCVVSRLPHETERLYLAFSCIVWQPVWRAPCAMVVFGPTCLITFPWSHKPFLGGLMNRNASCTCHSSNLRHFYSEIWCSGHFVRHSCPVICLLKSSHD